MNFKESIKRCGFTLMEILIATFIVAILLMITIPIVKRQLEKSEEYSYFLAYKTVERMAAQIVTMGDPDEISQIEPEVKLADKVKFFIADSSNKVKIFFASTSQKFAKSQEYILNRIFPSAFAQHFDLTEFSLGYQTYDDIWLKIQVCGYPDNDSTHIFYKSSQTTEVEVDNGDGTTSTEKHTSYERYRWADFGNCIGYGQPGVEEGETLTAYAKVEALYPPVCVGHSGINTIPSYIFNQSEPNAKTFCENKLRKSDACVFNETVDGTTYSYSVRYILDETGYSEGSDDDADDDDDDDDEKESEDGNLNTIPGGFTGTKVVHGTPEEEQGYCEIIKSFDAVPSTVGASSGVSQKPSFDANYCNTHMGTLNMTNAGHPESVDCVCSTGYTQTANNDRACCSSSSLPSGHTWYYNSLGTTESAKCVHCAGDFNPISGTCCPPHSTYVSGSLCTCATGYGPVGVCDTITSCPAGMTMKDGVCVLNPPIVKASKFCGLIKDFYNLSNYDCSAGFLTTNVKGVALNYRDDVYKAATSAAGQYLSIASKAGAFKDLTPNVEFSNGLPMWILSDKAASIPGLTFTTTGITETQNLCVNLRKYSSAACTAADSNAYYCKAENTCFTMDNASNAAMGDARNCCASASLTDLSEITATDPTYSADDYKKDKRTYAVSGFTVFVDINGKNKGSGTLWEDVFPFFIGANGTVYPAYPLDAPKAADSVSNSLYLGGNSNKQLSVDVYYYKADSSGEARQKVVAYPNVSYARGVCLANQLSEYSPYCMNLGEKFSSTITDEEGCTKNKCYISVKQKLRSF